MSTTTVELKVFHELGEIPRQSWDALLAPGDNPFVSWTFLEALERTGCVAPSRGWWPCHLTAWQDERLVAAAPAYVKNSSSGDFSRDWGLAESAARHGLSYYPKLVVGVPFSPVTGRRILAREGVPRSEAARVLLSLARQLCRHSDIGAVQVLYHLDEETRALTEAGMCARLLVQYHWHNRGYESFEDWLADLPSKKRTQIRRERKEPRRQGIAIRTVRGDELRTRAEHWARQAWRLYEANCDKHFWGGTYLDHAFFEHLFTAMPRNVELVVAERDDQVVAGAFNLTSPTHLFGRYWGCHEEHRFLHFNVCIYHSVEESIARGLEVFEGGAGGEHKLVRGFDPTFVYTSYLFLDEGFHDAVSEYFAAESVQRRREMDRWRR